MSTQVEELGGDRVRLTVEVPAHDMHHAVEHATSDLAESVRIPGFRKGKVPNAVLVQRLGKERVMAEAVESHIGGWFWNAAAAARIRPVEQPQYEYALPESGDSPWSFSATVGVQPKPELPDFKTLEVPYVEPNVPGEALDQALQQLQATVAELEPAEGRPARPGDTLVVDLVQAGGEVAERDYVVELGTGRLIDEIEEALVGMSAGDEKEVGYELADGSRRTLQATVKEIREKVLPPLDDELAKTASEFDTLEELRTDIESTLRSQLEAESESLFRSSVADALVDATRVNPTGPLVEARTRELLRGLARSLQSRGIDAGAYLQLTGQTPEQLEQRLRAEASRAVAREIVLETAADELGVEVADAEVRELLEAQGEAEETIERVFQSPETVAQLKEDLRLSKALDRVAADVQRIEPDLAAARESIWTPGKEAPEGEQKLWTPGS